MSQIIYDKETENGIPYIQRLYAMNTAKGFRYRRIVQRLDSLTLAEDAAMSGGTYRTYTLGDRSITREVLTPSEAIDLFDDLLAEKEELESGATRRKAVAVVPRDW